MISGFKTSRVPEVFHGGSYNSNIIIHSAKMKLEIIDGAKETVF